MQQRKSPDTYNNGGTINSGNQSPAIPIELVIFVAIAVIAWDAMKRWNEFEPVTRHILKIFNYIFYKPFYFTTNIYYYFSELENAHGMWLFFVKWGVISFYVIFLVGLYLSVIEILNQKKLTWILILFSILPLLTHGIWYFFLR